MKLRSLTMTALALAALACSTAPAPTPVAAPPPPTPAVEEPPPPPPEPEPAPAPEPPPPAAPTPPPPRPVEAPPAATKIRYAGGDGTSCIAAVVILGAKTTEEGVRAELRWLDQHFPGAETAGQDLLSGQGKHYDRFEVVTSDGRSRTVCFDITDFFGAP